MIKLRIVSITILITLLSVIQPAHAVIKNGSICLKANSITKVGSKVYRCGKNPYVKPNRLTWTLRGCFTANALLKDARQQYEDWKDFARLLGSDGEKTLNELQASITELESTMKNEVCKKGA